MERCPNCGAPARPGAKFCTTCGYRLPVAPPVIPPADPSDSATSSAAASWPSPPAQASENAATEQAPDQNAAPEPVSASDEVIAMPAPAPDNQPNDEDRETAPLDTASSTDSVLSSSWPSTTGPSQPSPWSVSETSATTEEIAVSDSAAGSDAGDEGDDAGLATATVTEETVVVADPASQYEGWSSSVVEEVAAPSASHGTNIARATALLEELRLLLPALNTGSGGGRDEAIAGELEDALSAGSQSASDREGLRDALNQARDNPRDIQTLLALSQQADAAIALLDEHDRLTSAVRHAVHALQRQRPGISE